MPLKRGTVSHMASIVGHYNNAAWWEHHHAVNTGNKQSQQKWERQMKQWDDEFITHYKHLIPKNEQKRFSLGFYETSDPVKFAKLWLK